MPDLTLIIDFVLWAVYLLLGVSMAAALWSAIHGVRTHEATVDPIASRHTSKTGYLTAGVVAVILLLTWLLGSTKAVMSNGHPYTDTFWLRLTDMFIFTSLLLICVCSVIVAIAKFRR
jgi:hypothetical protein